MPEADSMPDPKPAAPPPAPAAPRPAAPAAEKVLKKGETYWVVAPGDLDRPRQGRVILLSKTIGKYVGVEFAEPIGPHLVHTCDGRGKPGHCLYCHPDQLLTAEEYKALQARANAPPVAAIHDEVETLRRGDLPRPAPPAPKPA
jgi:hypothetical protein